MLVHTFLNSRSSEGFGRLESKEEKKSASMMKRRLSWIDDKNSLDTIERPVRRLGAWQCRASLRFASPHFFSSFLLPPRPAPSLSLSI